MKVTDCFVPDFQVIERSGNGGSRVLGDMNEQQSALAYLLHTLPALGTGGIGDVQFRKTFVQVTGHFDTNDRLQKGLHAISIPMKLDPEDTGQSCRKKDYIVQRMETGCVNPCPTYLRGNMSEGMNEIPAYQDTGPGGPRHFSRSPGVVACFFPS